VKGVDGETPSTRCSVDARSVPPHGSPAQARETSSLDEATTSDMLRETATTTTRPSSLKARSSAIRRISSATEVFIRAPSRPCPQPYHHSDARGMRAEACFVVRPGIRQLPVCTVVHGTCGILRPYNASFCSTVHIVTRIISVSANYCIPIHSAADPAISSPRIRTLLALQQETSNRDITLYQTFQSCTPQFVLFRRVPEHDFDVVEATVEP